MNQPPEKRKLLDEVLREGAPGEAAANESAADLPLYLSAAIRKRRHRRVKQRAVALAGVTLALVGLGFVALRRTRPDANKDMAQARIHEVVTSAPKVRTRKFQAAVVKTKDHPPLPKILPHAPNPVEIVVTEPISINAAVESSLQIVETKTVEASELARVETDESPLGDLKYVSTTRGGYHLLDDAALLARLAPRAVMLMRDAAGEEHLVFLDPNDLKDVHSG